MDTTLHADADADAAQAEADALAQVCRILDALDPPAGRRILAAVQDRRRREVDHLCRTLYELAQAIAAAAGELVPAELAAAGDPGGRLATIEHQAQDLAACLELLHQEIQGQDTAAPDGDR